MNGMMTNGMMNPMMNGFGFFMGLLGLLLFVALVVGGVFLVRWLLSDSGQQTPGRDRALEVARTRLAKGEISADEFEMIKQTLLAE